MHKVAVRPAVLYGLEAVALMKRQEVEMEVAQWKSLRFSSGVTRMENIMNKYTRGTAQVGRFGEKTREARLRWFGHVRRKDDGYIGRRVLRISWLRTEPCQKRGNWEGLNRGRVREDMAVNERGHGSVTEEDLKDAVYLRPLLA